MAWVNINNNRYYRRSRKVNARVVTEHLGGGEFGEMMASLDHSERMMRRMDAGLARADREVFGSAVRDVFEVGDFLGALIAVLARQSGFHQHHRQWRRTRRAIDMSGTPFSKKELERLGQQLEQAQVRRALMEPSFEGLPEADRTTLLAAANGDAAALERAKPYLTDPKFIKLWGNPMTAARCWLVGQVAGNDTVVASATHARVVMLQNELGFATANMLEKLAITRIVHNWLAVAAFDVRACQTPFSSRERANVEKSLGQAERPPNAGHQDARLPPRMLSRGADVTNRERHRDVTVKIFFKTSLERASVAEYFRVRFARFQPDPRTIAAIQSELVTELEPVADQGTNQ